MFDTICISFLAAGALLSTAIKIFKFQGSHRSLFPEKVLTIKHGLLGTGKVLSFNNFYKKVQEKSLFFADR